MAAADPAPSFVTSIGLCLDFAAFFLLKRREFSDECQLRAADQNQSLEVTTRQRDAPPGVFWL